VISTIFSSNSFRLFLRLKSSRFSSIVHFSLDISEVSSVEILLVECLDVDRSIRLSLFEEGREGEIGDVIGRRKGSKETAVFAVESWGDLMSEIRLARDLHQPRMLAVSEGSVSDSVSSYDVIITGVNRHCRTTFDRWKRVDSFVEEEVSRVDDSNTRYGLLLVVR